MGVEEVAPVTTVKTAISLDKRLFEAADDLAEALHISRSRLVALAIEEYVRRHRNLELLDQLNQAYADGDDEDDRARVRSMRRHHRAVLTGDQK
jgi:predicted transcriptional regulator